MKKCRSCKSEFEPKNSLDRYCKWQCALKDVRDKRIKKEKKEFNRETKRRKQAMKTLSDFLREAQTVFNRYIRVRDKDMPCISCGRYDWEINERLTGGKWDCGHYLTRGAHPELRFNTLNAHKQCKSCNGGSGNFSGKNKTVSESYRANLIEKIGVENVAWLEGPHELKKLEIDYLQRLKKVFAKRSRMIEKRRI